MRQAFSRLRALPSLLQTLVRRAALPSVSTPLRPFHRQLSLVLLAAVLGGVVYLGIFKVFDSDFWWHITAGKIMWETQSLIQEEPFAYTRAGQPYHTTYEWLSEVIFYLIHRAGGIQAVIGFRVGMLVAVFALLLAIHPRHIWPNGFLVLWAAIVTRIGFIERPQLFSFVLFAAFLLIIFQFLDAPPERKRWLLFLLLPLQVLWVNTHGAAGLLGVGIVGAAVLQTLVDWFHAPRSARTEHQADLRKLFFVLLLLVGAMFISPNGVRIFTYLYTLLYDQTIFLIHEWQPRPLIVQLKELGPFFALALLTVALVRRAWLFSLLLLSILGYFALQALRHEMFFVFAATGIIIYQCRHSALVQRWIDAVVQRRTLAIGLTVILVLLLGHVARARYNAFAHQYQLHGVGVFDRARGAADFLEREQITGTVFNTYGIGGYLVYRWYPRQKVFIDGRNVDHGLDIMRDTYFAGQDPERWNILEKKYGFTIAVIDNEPMDDEQPHPYSSHLDRNPSWKLVYLDDWVAVYLKDVPEHRTDINKYAYRALTPTRLDAYAAAEDAPAGDQSMLTGEFLRVMENNADGIKGHLGRAKLYIRSNQLNEAEPLVTEAMRRQPYRPEPHALHAALFVVREQWGDAAWEFDTAVRLAGDYYPDINYTFIADVFSRAGHPWKARLYRIRALMTQWKARSSLSVSSSEGKLSKTTQDDPRAQEALQKVEAALGPRIQHYMDEGIAFAQRGEFERAKEQFRKILEINPRHAEALSNLGAVYHNEGRWEEAVSYYEQALASVPDFTDAHENMAWALYHLRRFDASETHGKRAQELGRDMSRFFEELRKAQQVSS